MRTAIRRDGQFCCSFVANLLKYLYARNYEIIIRFDKVIEKIIRVHFFASQCIVSESISMENSNSTAP